MSESESETGTPVGAVNQEISGTRYPVEGKFISLKDKADIMAMPEAKREQILSERMEEVEKENFSRQLLQRREAEQKAADAAEKKKRKAASNEVEDSPRKFSKQKTVANNNLANYKKKREQMNEARRTGAGRRDRNKQSPSQLFNEASSAESEAERDDGKPNAAAPPRKEPEATLRDFETVRMGRSAFGNLCFTPGFEKAMPGCFARVNIGPNQATGQNVYRMAEIRAIITGKPYSIEDQAGNPFYTDQYARTGSGKGEKTFPFIACSDGRFTMEEFERFKRDQLKDGLKLPTYTPLLSRAKSIHDLVNHSWTSEEITAKIERSGKRKEHWNRLDRARFRNERKHAVAIGDHERVAQIDADLEDMGAIKPPLTSIHTNNSSKKQPESQSDRIARMNEINRKAELEHRRKVQLAEKRRERLAAEKGIVDPFARVKTVTITHHDSAAYDSARSQAGTPEPSALPNGTATNASKASSGNTLQVPGQDKSIDDLFSEGGDRSRSGTPAKSVDGSSKAETPAPSFKAKTGGVIERKKKMDDLANFDIGLDIEL